MKKIIILEGQETLRVLTAAMQHSNDTVSAPDDKEEIDWMYRVHASEFDLNSPMQAPTLRDTVRENAGMFLDEEGVTPVGKILLEYLDIAEPEAHLYDVYRDLGGVPEDVLNEIEAKNIQKLQLVIEVYNGAKVMVKIGTQEIECN